MPAFGSTGATILTLNASDAVPGGTPAGTLIVRPGAVTWFALPLLGGWVDYDTTFATARYCKNSAGTVFIEGLIKSGTVSASFTFAGPLPAGFRPAGHLIMAAQSNNAFASFDVTSSGNLTQRIGVSAAYFSINCSFQASQ
jgi:hypothetical protein